MKNSELQLGGVLFKQIDDIRKEILYEMAFIESAIDDPENYDLTGFDEKLSKLNTKWIDKINKLIKYSEYYTTCH